METLDRLREPDKNVVGGSQGAQQPLQRKQQSWLQKQQQKQQQKKRRPYVVPCALRKAASNLAGQRRNGKTPYLLSVTAPRREQLRRFDRLAKPDGEACFFEFQKDRISLTCQLQPKLTQKRNTAHVSQGHVCQKHLRVGQRRSLDNGYQKPQQRSQAKLLQKNHQGMAEEKDTIYKTSPTSPARDRSKADLFRVQQYGGRRRQQQGPQQTQQTTPHEPGAEETRCTTNDRKQRGLSESPAVDTEENKEGIRNGRDRSSIAKSAFPTWMYKEYALCLGPFSMIQWLWLRLERLLHWDEEVDNCLGLKPDVWKTMVSEFFAQYYRLKKLRSQCGGLGALPSSPESNGARTVEVEMPAGIRKRESLGDSQDIYHSRPEGFLHLSDSEEASLIALVAAVLKEAANGKQDISWSEQAARLDEARNIVSAMLTQQLQRTKDGGCEYILLLRAAAALPRSTSRRDGSRIEEQLKALRFLGLKEDVLLLTLLMRQQGSGTTFSEREQGTPSKQVQAQQQSVCLKLCHLQLPEDGCLCGSSCLQEGLCHLNRGKLFFHDELGLLQRAYLVFHAGNSAFLSSGDTSVYRHSCRQPAGLETEQLLHRIKELASVCRGTAVLFPSDDSVKKKAHAAVDHAVKCEAVVAVHNALAERGVTMTNIAALVPPWVPSDYLQPRTSERDTGRWWWSRLGWTFYILRGTSARTPVIDGNESHPEGVLLSTTGSSSAAIKCSAPFKSELIASSVERDGRDISAATIAAAELSSIHSQRESDISVTPATRPPVLQVARHDVSVGSPLMKMHLKEVVGGIGKGKSPLTKAVDSELSKKQAQFVENARDTERANGSGCSGTLTQTLVKNANITGLSVQRQSATRKHSSRSRTDHQFSQPDSDSAPPYSVLRSYDIHRHAFVCRLCGRVILPEWQRTSVDAHVLHLLRRHRKLVALWVLLLDVRGVSHSVRRLFVKIVASALQRQQPHQRPARPPGNAGAADDATFISTTKVCTKHQVFQSCGPRQVKNRSLHYGTISGMASYAVQMQMEALERLVYPIAGGCIAMCLLRVRRALLLQHMTAWRVQQLLQFLRQQMEFPQTHVEEIPHEEPSLVASKIDHLCEKVKAAKPLSTVAIFPSLWSVQRDRTLCLMKKQFSPDCAPTSYHFPTAGEQPRAAPDKKFQQYVICWMPHEVFRHLDADGSSTSHALLHGLLQARGADAGSVSSLFLFPRTSLSFDSGKQGACLQSHQRSPCPPQRRRIMKGAIEASEASGLFLQAAGLCNEEFEVVNASCGRSQRGSNGRSLLRGLSTGYCTDGQGGSSTKRTAISPFTAGLRNTNSCNKAFHVDEGSNVTESLVAACSPQSFTGASSSTLFNFADSAGAANLLFPRVPLEMERKERTCSDGRAFLRLQKPFSSAATAGTDRSTWQYLLHYVLALTSSGFLLPCILRSTFCECHSSRCSWPASDVAHTLLIKAREASRPCFATAAAGHSDFDATAARHLAGTDCSGVSALAGRATGASYRMSYAAASCDSSQGNVTRTKKKSSHRLGSDGRSHATHSDTAVTTSASWDKSPSGHVSRTTLRLATSDTGSISIGSSLASRRVFVTTGRFERKRKLLLSKDAHVAAARSPKLSKKQSFFTESNCRASNACLTGQVDFSPSSRNSWSYEYPRKTTVQQSPVESTAPLSCPQGAADGDLNRESQSESSTPVRPTWTSFPSVRRALHRFEQSGDNSAKDTQQSMTKWCIDASCQEQVIDSAEGRKLFSGYPVALREPRFWEATASSLDSTLMDAERKFRLVVDQAMARTSPTSTARILHTSHSFSTCSLGIPLGPLHLDEECEVAEDSLSGKSLRGRGGHVSHHQLTRYSWYEAFALIPRLPCSHSCGLEVKRRHSTPTHAASYFPSLCTAERHVCSRESQPVEEKDFEIRAVALPATQYQKGSEVLLRQFHLVALQPSVAVTRSEGCDSHIISPKEDYFYNYPAGGVLVGGVTSALWDRGSAGLRIYEVKLASSTSGNDSGEGAQLQCKFSGGDCGVESMLQPVSLCSVSFIVSCTSVCRSAAAYGRTHRRRTDSDAHARPAEHYRTGLNDRRELKVARSDATGCFPSGVNQADKPRQGLRGNVRRAVNVAASWSPKKDADSDADVNTFLALRRVSAFFPRSKYSKPRRGFSSNFVRRDRKLVFTASGLVPPRAGGVGPQSVKEGCCESRALSPCCFLSFLCSHRRGQSHACLLQLPCSSSSAAAGSYVSTCSCPLATAQAAAVAAVLYGQYGSLCAEVSTLLLTDRQLVEREAAVYEHFGQQEREKDEQNGIPRFVPQSCNTPYQAPTRTVTDLRNSGVTENFRKEIIKTRTLLLRLIVHQLQCPLATEIMSRDDFLYSLLTGASCKDCRAILRRLLRTTQLQMWLRIGTNYLVRKDGSTPESAAALAACAALDNRLYTRSLNHCIFRGSHGRQATDIVRPCALMRMIRRLATLVLSNVLSVFFKFVEVQTEIRFHRHQLSTPEEKDKGKGTSTQDVERCDFPLIDPLDCRSPMTGDSRQEDHQGLTKNQTQGHCRALIPQPLRKRRTESGRRETGEICRNAGKLKKSVRSDCVGAMVPGGSLFVGQTHAKSEREHLLCVEVEKPSSRSGRNKRRWIGRDCCSVSTERGRTNMDNKLFRSRKRSLLDFRSNTQKHQAEMATSTRITKVQHSGCVMRDSAGNTEEQLFVSSKKSHFRDIHSKRGSSTSTDTVPRADTGGSPLFCSPSEVCGQRGKGLEAGGPAFSLSQANFRRKRKRSNVSLSSRVGDVNKCSVVPPASQLPLLCRGTHRSAEQALDPSLTVPEATCKACIEAEQRVDTHMSGQTNQDQIDAPHCALANVVAVPCPSARQECVNFGGFVRLCDDVKTGLHLQVTPFLTYIRRGAPLFIRHQLQRSGIRQSVLVESFIARSSSRDVIDLSSKVTGSSPSQAHSKMSPLLDNSKRCAPLLSRSASQTSRTAMPAPAAGIRQGVHENPATSSQRTQHLSAQRTSSCKHRGSGEITAKAPCDQVPTAVRNTSNPYEQRKQRQQPSIEISQGKGVGFIKQTSGRRSEGKILKNTIFKREEKTATGTGSMRCMDPLQESRIDLFAWNLLLENDIRLSLSDSTLLSGDSHVHIDEQATDAESSEQVNQILRRFEPRRDNAVYVKPLSCYRRTRRRAEETTELTVTLIRRGKSDASCHTAATMPRTMSVVSPGAPMMAGQLRNATGLESVVASSFLRTRNACKLSVNTGRMHVCHRDREKLQNVWNTEVSVEAASDRDDELHLAFLTEKAVMEPASVTYSSPLQRITGSTSESIHLPSYGKCSPQLVNFTASSRAAIHQHCAVASPSLCKGVKARSDVVPTEQQIKQQPVVKHTKGENKGTLLQIKWNESQISAFNMLSDECYDEAEPDTQETQQCESVPLEVTTPTDGVHAEQSDVLLPTDGNSHCRLLGANWQAVDSSSLVPATQRMQELNVSPFHGLVVSEDGMLPENARLQLRRNELFFSVDQRERQARLAALLESTATRLGVKVPSFLARTKILKLKKSNVHGWGVFAGEPIYRDEFIVEYSSSVISDALANFREWQYMQSLGAKTYFFKLKNTCIVDATCSGGLTRFINHSCRPNCRTQDISNEGVDETRAHCHLGLYALRDIVVGEELFYDYSLSEGTLGIEACRCGSPMCKGFM